MKHNFLLFAMLGIACSFSVRLSAQLHVLSSGHVKADNHVAINGCVVQDSVALNVAYTRKSRENEKIGSKYGVSSYVKTTLAGNNAHTVCALNGYCQGYGTLYGVRGEAMPQGNSVGAMNRNAYGVYGIASSTNAYSYGVCGIVKATVSKGAGIYGSNDGTTQMASGRYAGYFQGQTKVNGSFYATTVTQTSDARLKANVTGINEYALLKIRELRPVQFNWLEEALEDDDDNKHLSEDTDFKRKHYGFLAQEVQKLYPELVYADAEGYLGINYTELIPLLIQSVQELSEKVELLESGNTDNTARKPSRVKSSASDIQYEAVLYQNNPNPFSANTEIEYQLPLSTKTASLYVYNMNGLQIAEYPISSFGTGSVTISAGDLDAGMYLYSLIADDQVIDTKRMILTK